MQAAVRRDAVAAHGTPGKGGPGVSVESESGIEPLGVVEDQRDERGGDVSGHAVGDDPDLLR